MRRQSAALALAGVFLATAYIPAGGAHAEPPASPGRPAFCDDRSVIPAAALENGHATSRCDISGRIVRGRLLSVVVPPNGQGVAAHASGEVPADADELIVEHRDGRVQARGAFQDGHHAQGAGAAHAPSGAAPASGRPDDSSTQLPGDASDGENVPAGADQACSQFAYLHLDRKERDTHRWFFNHGSTPSYIAASNAAVAVSSGANWVTTGSNACGLPTGGLTSSHYYDGTTTRLPSGQGTSCTTRDDVNVRGFRDLGGSLVALACSWTDFDVVGQANELGESDHTYDASRSNFVTSLPSSCSGKQDLASAATHEWGHTFGLGHVDETSYPYMTMSPLLPSCSTTARSLGRGDYQGMFERYRVT